MKKKIGRPPTAPFKGAKAVCAHCTKKFTLSDGQRSDIRRGVKRSLYCGGGCQRGANGAKNGRNNAHKISAARLALFGASTHYRKVNGRHEHRTVAEKVLGRKLRKGEIVHHKDGNKRNNAPGNLQVMTQAAHARHHMKQRFKNVR